jgi:hypothetical protein
MNKIKHSALPWVLGAWEYDFEQRVYVFRKKPEHIMSDTTIWTGVADGDISNQNTVKGKEVLSYGASGGDTNGCDCDVGVEANSEDMEFIVRACNCYYDLLAACNNGHHLLNVLANYLTGQQHDTCRETLEATIKQMYAAIAKAQANA